MLTRAALCNSRPMLQTCSSFCAFSETKSLFSRPHHTKRTCDPSAAGRPRPGPVSSLIMRGEKWADGGRGRESRRLIVQLLIAPSNNDDYRASIQGEKINCIPGDAGLCGH